MCAYFSFGTIKMHFYTVICHVNVKKIIATAISVDVGKVKLAPNPQNGGSSLFNSFFLCDEQVWRRNLHFAWHVSGQISILGLNRKKLCMYTCIASILVVNI